MLGSDLVAAATEGVTVATCSDDGTRIDVTDATAVARALDTVDPSVVINAAAYTRVDDAEAQTELAMSVNGSAVGQLGALCAARHILVVHFSSDYVFSGSESRPYREDDSVSPVNAYGRSKLAGEVALQASGAEMLIIRTQWLFGLNGRSFPRTMWERARERLTTHVVTDQLGRPTSTKDLAAATWQLIALGARGIVHVANQGQATWFEFAKQIFDAKGATDHLWPCVTSEYPTRARRPAYSVLDTSRFESLTGSTLPHWSESLTRFLASCEKPDRAHSSTTRSGSNVLDPRTPI